MIQDNPRKAYYYERLLDAANSRNITNKNYSLVLLNIMDADDLTGEERLALRNVAADLVFNCKLILDILEAN